MDEEVGVRLLQARECQELPTVNRRQERSTERILPQSPEGANPTNTLIMNFD